MNRRDFLAGFAAMAGSAAGGCSAPMPLPRFGDVMTVRGRIAPGEMGVTLPHEHVMVDFTPFEELGPRRYDPVEVVEIVLPRLNAARDLGIRTIVETTPAYLGRDPQVLRALSERSGIHIVASTGYYGARDDQHLPDHAFDASDEDLARRWIGEWREGIDGSGIRPGVVKIGVDPGALSEIDAKLVRAAARAHLETGLTVAAHTGAATAAFEEIDILEEMNVHPSAWIWVHAQAEEDMGAHVEAARRGAWVEFDAIRPDSIDRHVELVRNMRDRGLLQRVLVSHDAGWYTVGEPGGGDYRPYTTLVTDFIPALREAGFEDEEVNQLVRLNPAEAFRIRIRSRSA